MPNRRSRASQHRALVTPRRLLLAAGLIAAAALAAVIGPPFWVIWRTAGQRYSNAQSVPVSDAAIVFGAGLQANGTPQPLLADRIHAAVLLWQAGKVRRLLLSGDGLSPGHDEPAAMAKQAQSEGVPASALQRDPAGLHTYESCLRAHDDFGVRSAVVVSQSYHLPRAIFTCERVGIRTSGFSFARTAYGADLELRVREFASLDAAWWELNLKRLV